MWTQPALPFSSMAASLIFALAPPAVLLSLSSIGRVTVLRATLLTLVGTLLLVCTVWQMPIHLALLSLIQGALLGATGIGWVIMAGLFAVNVLRESGYLEAICSDLIRLSPGRSFQALLIGFCLNGFLESISGYGVPVLTVALLLMALDWTWREATIAALIGNGLTVAFGALGTPVTTLVGLTHLSGSLVGLYTALLVLPIIPFGLALFLRLTCGAEGLREAGWRAIRTGLVYGIAQAFTVLFGGAELAGVVGSLAATIVLVLESRPFLPFRRSQSKNRASHWSPLLWLVGLLLLFKVPLVHSWLIRATWSPAITGLDGQILLTSGARLHALIDLGFVAHPGTAVLLGAVITGLALARNPSVLLDAAKRTWTQARLNLISTICLLALATLMANAGLTGTIGLALQTTGPALPLVAPLVGWLGGMLTGSATSANALFGPAQVAAAQAGRMSSYLMAAANTVGGAVAKMGAPLSISMLDGVGPEATADEKVPTRELVGASLYLVLMVSPIVLLCNLVLQRT